MDKLQVAMFAAASASICTFAGCTANVHDNAINVEAQLSFQTDVNGDVKPGDSVSVSMNATNVVLVEPSAQPATADADKAFFFKVFLDDEESEPLLMTAQTHTEVKIPKKTPQGKHHLICRLFRHDGMATNVEQSVSINVSASATITTLSDAGTVHFDAGVGAAQH